MLNKIVSILLSVFIFHFLSAGQSFSSNETVSGEIRNGFRILELDTTKSIHKFTVYRGDYIKLGLPKGLGETVAVFSTLKQTKQISPDLETSPYFKMDQPGVHPFQIGSIKGEITIIEYREKSYRTLSAKEADALIKTHKPFILDVRTPKEYAMQHIENSLLIPVQELQARIHELTTYRNDPILIYCATGNRSTVASKILIDSGFTQIYNLKDGIVDWGKKAYPVTGGK